MTALRRELHVGCVGRDVLAAKYALKAALGAASKADTRNRKFGPGTAGATRAFQRQHNLASDGVIGPNTWSVLEPFLPASKRWLIAVAAPKPQGTAEQRARQRIVHFCSVLVDARPRYHQWRPVPLHIPPLPKPDNTDCSGSVTQIYKLAGCPDPNGKHYDGEAYTGYLRNHGRKIAFADALPGDLLHHGTGRPGDPQHVTILVDKRRGIAFTFGSNPAHFVNLAGYRRILLVTRHDLTL